MATIPEPGWPDDESALGIHSRLVAEDPVASSDLALAYLVPLVAWLEQRNPQIDPHICATAAEDAILSLIKKPATFQPARSSLSAYLRMSATGDLRNALRSEARHGRRRASLVDVELLAVEGNRWCDGVDVADIVERSQDGAALVERGSIRSVPESVRTRLTAGEQQVLDLMRRGERRTAAFAAALGISSLSVEEQRREVKRAKDRLNRRIERAGGSSG